MQIVCKNICILSKWRALLLQGRLYFFKCWDIDMPTKPRSEDSHRNVQRIIYCNNKLFSSLIKPDLHAEKWAKLKPAGCVLRMQFYRPHSNQGTAKRYHSFTNLTCINDDNSELKKGNPDFLYGLRKWNWEKACSWERLALKTSYMNHVNAVIGSFLLRSTFEAP